MANTITSQGALRMFYIKKRIEIIQPNVQLQVRNKHH